MIPRILVCGGRDFTDREFLFQTLDRLCEVQGWITKKDEFGNFLPVVIIIHGKAKGADTLSGEWAALNWCQTEEFPADWDNFGKGAGFIRNQEMIDTKPDLVLAFPGGNGTADTVRRAKKAGIEVIAIPGSKWHTEN